MVLFGVSHTASIDTSKWKRFLFPEQHRKIETVDIMIVALSIDLCPENASIAQDGFWSCPFISVVIRDDAHNMDFTIFALAQQHDAVRIASLISFSIEYPYLRIWFNHPFFSYHGLLDGIHALEEFSGWDSGSDVSKRHGENADRYCRMLHSTLSVNNFRLHTIDLSFPNMLFYLVQTLI